MSRKSVELAFAAAAEAAAPRVTGRASIRVAPQAEFQEGVCRIVNEGPLSIGVYLVGGKFHAIRNYCPHQGAPLCRGSVHATHAPSEVGEFTPTLHGRIVRCPWHGWEFDIASGKGLYDARDRVKTYATRVDADGIVWVDL
jgi:nitrite reductase/ring-hydroxylating ferredoxin subunit